MCSRIVTNRFRKNENPALVEARRGTSRKKVRRRSIVMAAARYDQLPPSNGPRNFSHIEQHRIVSLGGVDRDGRPVLLCYACRLPPRDSINHADLLDYLRETLDHYVDCDYTIVYFHHGLRSSNKPGMQWLLQAYKALDRRYKKNLKKLYLVHPTNFIKAVMTFFRPFISAKFGRKVTYVNRIEELSESLFIDQMEIPDEVICCCCVCLFVCLLIVVVYMREGSWPLSQEQVLITAES